MQTQEDENSINQDRKQFRISSKLLGTAYGINPNINISEYIAKLEDQYKNVQWRREQEELRRRGREYDLLVSQVLDIVKKLNQLYENVGYSELIQFRQSELNEMVNKGLMLIESSTFYPFKASIELIEQAREEYEMTLEKIKIIKNQFIFLTNLSKYAPSSTTAEKVPQFLNLISGVESNSNDSFAMLREVVQEQMQELAQSYRETIRKEQECKQKCEGIEAPVKDIIELIHLYIRLRQFQNLRLSIPKSDLLTSQL
jgi:hypothetical protein